MWLLPFLLLPLFLLISCKKNKGMKKKQQMKGGQSAKSSVLSGGGGGRELSTNKSRELILTGGGGSKETLTCGSRETLSKEGNIEGVSEPAGELLYSTEPAGEKKEASKLDKFEKKQGNKEKTVAGTKAGQEKKKKKPPKREEEKELQEMEATQRSEIAEEDGEAKGMEPSKILEAKKSPVLPVKEPPSPISKDGIYVPTLFLQWKPEIVEEGQYEQMTPPGNKEEGQYENLGGEKSAVHGVEKSSDGGGEGGQYEALGPALSSRPSQESLYEQMGSVNTAGKEGLYEALGDSPSKMCRPSPTKT